MWQGVEPWKRWVLWQMLWGLMNKFSRVWRYLAEFIVVPGFKKSSLALPRALSNFS